MHPLTPSLKAHGFSEPVEVGTLRTIAHLFGTRKSRTGLYALVLPDDRIYIGQSADVVGVSRVTAEFTSPSRSSRSSVSGGQH